jgi:hypothetical protein
MVKIAPSIQFALEYGSISARIRSGITRKSPQPGCPKPPGGRYLQLPTSVSASHREPGLDRVPRVMLVSPSQAIVRRP